MRRSWLPKGTMKQFLLIDWLSGVRNNLTMMWPHDLVSTSTSIDEGLFFPPSATTLLCGVAKSSPPLRNQQQQQKVISW